MDQMETDGDRQRTIESSREGQQQEKAIYFCPQGPVAEKAGKAAKEENRRKEFR